eukprot:gene13804-29354_t
MIALHPNPTLLRESENELHIACVTCDANYIAAFLFDEEKSNYFGLWLLSSRNSNLFTLETSSCKFIVPVRGSTTKPSTMTMRAKTINGGVIFAVIGVGRGLIYRFEFAADGQLTDYVETSVTERPARVIFDNEAETMISCEGRFVVVRSEQLKRSARSSRMSSDPVDTCLLAPGVLAICLEEGRIVVWRYENTDCEISFSSARLSGCSSSMALVASLTGGRGRGRYGEGESMSLVAAARDGKLWLVQVVGNLYGDSVCLREVNRLDLAKETRFTATGARRAYNTDGLVTSMSSTVTVPSIAHSSPPLPLAMQHFPNVGLCSGTTTVSGKLMLVTPTSVLSVDCESFTLEEGSYVCVEDLGSLGILSAVAICQMSSGRSLGDVDLCSGNVALRGELKRRNTDNARLSSVPVDEDSAP